jgi:hypothetical protein
MPPAPGELRGGRPLRRGRDGPGRAGARPAPSAAAGGRRSRSEAGPAAPPRLPVSPRLAAVCVRFVLGDGSRSASGLYWGGRGPRPSCTGGVGGARCRRQGSHRPRGSSVTWRAAQEASARAGALNVAVANAGAAAPGYFTEQGPEVARGPCGWFDQFARSGQFDRFCRADARARRRVLCAA